MNSPPKKQAHGPEPHTHCRNFPMCQEYSDLCVAMLYVCYLRCFMPSVVIFEGAVWCLLGSVDTSIGPTNCQTSSHPNDSHLSNSNIT